MPRAIKTMQGGRGDNGHDGEDFHVMGGDCDAADGNNGGDLILAGGLGSSSGAVKVRNRETGQNADVVGRVSAPSTAGSSGVAGQVAYDSSYFYVCTATNTWKRVAIATW